MNLLIVQFYTVRDLNRASLHWWSLNKQFSKSRMIIAVNSPEKIRASPGFEPVTSTIPVRCCTNWAMKPHIGSEVNLLTSYLAPVRSEMMWSIYEIIHIWPAVVDESEEWYSQYIFQFKQLERRSLKKTGLQRDSNPWPPRYRCDVLPTELWSHTLRARSIYWVHQCLPWGVKWCEIYMK